MPECPEVLITAQFLNAILKNIKLIDIVLPNVKNSKIKNFKKFYDNNNTLLYSVQSKGKFMWFSFINDLNEYNYCACTFGLTGYWIISNDLIKNSRIKFIFDNYTLQYVDQLNFGSISFFNNLNYINDKIKKLAPDVIQSNMTDNEMFDYIKHKIKICKNNKKIIEILMDQHFLFSGIGNYLVSEILYYAKISPHKVFKFLNDTELSNLIVSIKKICKTMYVNNFSDYIKFKNTINSFFFNYYPNVSIINNYTYNVYNQSRDKHGYSVIKESIVKDRFAYWVRELQF